MTRATEKMAASLEDAGVNVLSVSERDDGELRVIHQLGDDDTVDDAELDIGRVAGVFLAHRRAIERGCLFSSDRVTSVAVWTAAALEES